ncbi:hypothetical protein ACFRLW_26110, partial [Streptomyces sp. NPDC056728]
MTSPVATSHSRPALSLLLAMVASLLPSGLNATQEVPWLVNSLGSVDGHNTAVAPAAAPIAESVPRTRVRRRSAARTHAAR